MKQALQAPDLASARRVPAYTGMVMPEQSRLVLDLQALDLEIGRLTQRIEQIESALSDQTKARAADYATRQAAQAYQDRQRELRALEMDLASIEERIKGAEQKLYSGKGSPRELQALQREIEHDRARRGQIEEKALVAMEAAGAAAAEVDRIKGAVARVLANLDAERQQLRAERDELQQTLERTRRARQETAKSIDPPALALYERLRARMADGIAAAEVIQGHCNGCRTSLPSAEIQRARRAETLTQCSVCGRILHVPLG